MQSILIFAAMDPKSSDSEKVLLCFECWYASKLGMKMLKIRASKNPNLRMIQNFVESRVGQPSGDQRYLRHPGFTYSSDPSLNGFQCLLILLE